MGLSRLDLEGVFRTGDDDLLKDFYIPCLKESIQYDRAVGFFSSAIFVNAFTGITEFLKNNGKMRLVIGWPLTDEEYEQVKKGEAFEYFDDQVLVKFQEFESLSFNKLLKLRLEVFYYLVASKRLEIKFAYRPHGMYHEKVGIFKDIYGNKILFTGSANETLNAVDLDKNFESIISYKNTNSEIYEKWAYKYELGFEKIWNGSDPFIKTINLSDKSYQYIQSKANKLNFDTTPQLIPDEIEVYNSIIKDQRRNYPTMPIELYGNAFSLFEHQDKAINEFYGNNGVGILKLATGAGKTITAISAVTRLFNHAQNNKTRLFFIVAVPYIPLAEQWVKDFKLFNMKPIKCFGSRDSWYNQLSSKISNFCLNQEDRFGCAIVVNATLRTPHFQDQLNRLPKDLVFFVSDECHHHSTESYQKLIPNFRFRMGLSATPYTDPLDTGFDIDFLRKSFMEKLYGDIVSEFTLADALALNILTPYNYYVIPVYLTIDESEEYIDLSKRIASVLAGNSGELSENVKHLIRLRNKIIQNASGKKIALQKALTEYPIRDKSHTLFYVGEGSALDSAENTENISQLNEIAKILEPRGWAVSKFTAEENPGERLQIMSNFKDKSIDALISMRVLDEGIDIPACHRAFILASSSNKRQFIQRRGRVLRKAKGKDFAEIFDFVVFPNVDIISNTVEFKSLLEREVIRVMDFVRLAKNRNQVECVVNDAFSMFAIDIRSY